MADNKYKLQFTLSNGETINAGEIVAPQGPKGDKGDKGDSADIPYSSSTPFMDGVGSVGSANTVARGDHRHPSDTSRQEKLVSGENIKTINGQSVLGSGDIPISGGGTIDADTLNGLLSGSNGIAIAKNTAGDKVEAKLAIPETGPISLANNNVPRPAISIEVANGGPPAFGGIQISSAADSNKVVQLGPRQILATNGTSELTFDATGIISRYNGNEVGHGLISGGPNGNVKTLFGNQSIYGSGNIDSYRHNITIKVNKAGTQVAWICTIHISSSNTPIDSVSDFLNIFSSIGYAYPFMGFCRYDNGGYNAVINVEARSSGAISFAGNTPSISWSDTSFDITVEDTVTTV